MASENLRSVGAVHYQRPLVEIARRIGMSEYKQASATLCEAFMEDDVIRYPIDTPDMESSSRERKHGLYVETMDYVTAAHIQSGLVTTMGPNYASVAIWLPPGKDTDTWCTLFRSGLWRLYYKLSREGRRRFFTEFLPLLQDTKRNVLGERDNQSYYLVYLGTRSCARRQGYGTALIEHVTKQADLENRACYLESTAAKNVAMYRSRGFVFLRTIYLNPAGTPIPIDIMVREPVPPSPLTTIMRNARDGAVSRSGVMSFPPLPAMDSDGEKDEAAKP